MSSVPELNSFNFYDRLISWLFGNLEANSVMPQRDSEQS